MFLFTRAACENDVSSRIKPLTHQVNKIVVQDGTTSVYAQLEWSHAQHKHLLPKIDICLVEHIRRFSERQTVMTMII